MCHTLGVCARRHVQARHRGATRRLYRILAHEYGVSILPIHCTRACWMGWYVMVMVIVVVVVVLLLLMLLLPAQALPCLRL